MKSIFLLNVALLLHRLYLKLHYITLQNYSLALHRLYLKLIYKTKYLHVGIKCSSFIQSVS